MRSPPLRGVVLAAGAILAARLSYWLFAPPNSDEAYYWIWGAHPAWSYFDHPPLHAWVQGAVRVLLGTNFFTLRLAPALTTVGTSLVLIRLVRRLSLDGAPGIVFPSLVAAFATPLLLLFTGFAWMDHLLIFFGLVAMDLFGAFYGEVASGRNGSTKKLFGGAIALGLAALSKYNAAFLGFAFAGVALWDPRLRRLWKEPRFYLAALVAVAILTPVIAWNLSHHMASFRYHLVNRHVGDEGVHWSVSGPFRFILPFVVLCSPFLLAALVRPLKVPSPLPRVEVQRKLAVLGFFIPTVTFLAIGTFSTALYYWNIVGLVAVLPFVGALLARPRLLASHLFFGVLVTFLLCFHGEVVPFTALVPGIDDDESRNPWGWDEIAAQVEAEREKSPGSFAATSDYHSGAALGFALLARGVNTRDADVVVLSPRRSAFDDWRDEEDLLGRDAVLITDRQARMWSGLASAFRDVKRLGTVETARLGVPMKPWELWLGSGYRTPDFVAGRGKR